MCVSACVFSLSSRSCSMEAQNKKRSKVETRQNKKAYPVGNISPRIIFIYCKHATSYAVARYAVLFFLQVKVSKRVQMSYCQRTISSNQLGAKRCARLWTAPTQVPFFFYQVHLFLVFFFFWKTNLAVAHVWETSSHGEQHVS